MTVTPEAHVELLLGRRVRDADGSVIGRLEDFRVDVIDGESCVTEYHIGAAAIVERITGFATCLPFIDLLPFLRTEYRVRWQDMDLSDPRHPRIHLRRAELQRVPRDMKQ